MISRQSYHGEYTRFLNWFCLRGVWKSHNLTYLLKWSINKSKNKCIYFVDCISSEDLMQQFFLWFWKNVLLKISLHFWRFMLASPSNLSLNFFFTVFLLFLGRKHKWVLQERQVPRSAQSKIPNDVSCFWGKVKLTCYYSLHDISYVILLHDKFVQFDWLRAVVFQLNLKCLHVKITNLFGIVSILFICMWYLA